jgi:tetratricopeptide (TPR) repeat protein
MEIRMSKHTPVRIAACVVALLLIFPIVALAAGGSSTSSSSDSVPSDPKAMAKDSYNRALKYRDKAWEYEAKAAAAEGSDREKMMKKAEKEFTKALKALDTAVSNDPRLYQAHSSRGYVLRKMGDYEESLAAYNLALEINPRYAEAIEYRAEAYLGLNRIAEAKDAYMELFRTDRKRADELMEAMQGWVEARQADAAGVDSSVIADFSSWVEERSSMAMQTGDTSGGRW